MEFNEGDLVEATKGDTVIRGRMGQFPGNGLRPIFTVTDAVRFDPLHLEANGYTLTVIEKAAPALPTEPGIYLDATGSTWRLDSTGFTRLYDRADNAEDHAPFTRLEPVADTAKKVLDRFREVSNASFIRFEDALKSVRAEFGVTDD